MEHIVITRRTVQYYDDIQTQDNKGEEDRFADGEDRAATVEHPAGLRKGLAQGFFQSLAGYATTI